MSTDIYTDIELDYSRVVSSNIRAYAGRLRWKPIDLARALGMKHGTVNQKWKNERAWHLAELGRVAYVLGVEVSDLVTPPRDFERWEYENTPAEAGARWWAHRESNPEPTD